MGCGFTSGGQESGCAFVWLHADTGEWTSTTLSPYHQCWNIRSCFSQGKGSAVQLPLDHAFANRTYLIDICKPSIAAQQSSPRYQDPLWKFASRKARNKCGGPGYKLNIIPSRISRTSPSLTRYSAELPLISNNALLNYQLWSKHSHWEV